MFVQPSAMHPKLQAQRLRVLSRRLLTAAVLLSVCWVAAPSSASAADGESSRTLQSLIEARRVDSLIPGPSGSLFAWDSESGRGVLVDPGAEGAPLLEVRGSAGLDAAISPGGRRAFLVSEGRWVEIQSPEGEPMRLDLGQAAGAIAWIGDERLVVSPTNGSHRLEIRDVATGDKVIEIDPTPRISEAPGYRLLRATDLAWDPERRILHTLDAATGEYRSYELPEGRGGAALRNVSRIEDASRARYEELVAATDKQLAERGEFQGATLWRFSVGVAPDGSAWTVERCDARAAHLLALRETGQEHRFEVPVPCCSLSALPWGDDLLFFRPAHSQNPACFARVPRPSLPASSTTWLEVTPLSPRSDVRSRKSPYAPALFFRSDSPAPRFSEIDAGLALVCSGGDRRPLDCEQVWLDPETTRIEELLPVGATEHPGRPVVGRITAEDAAVSGATVALVPADFRTTRLVTLPLVLPAGAQEPVRQITTDADGRFRLPALDSGDYRLLLTLPGGRIDRSTTFTVAGSRVDAILDLGTLDFPAGLSLEVLVAGPDGQPIPGSVTGAAQEDPTTDEPGAVAIFQVTADARGGAVIAGLDPALPVSVTCRAPGHRLWREAFDVPPASVPCTLDPLGRIAGRVVDEDGEPLAGASLTLTGGSGFSVGAVETATTDEEGAFLFEGLEPGRFGLVAASPGRGTWNRGLALQAGDSRELGDLVLEAGERWRHRVLGRFSASGRPEPVAGATLVAVDPSDAVVPASTDVYGEAEVEGPATGPLLLEVRADGFAPRRVEVPEATRSLDAEPHEIVLDPAGWIVAHVWDGPADAPCAGCRVSLSGPGEPQSLVTDGTGKARSEPLAPGTWRASLARLRGYGVVVTRSGGDDSRTAVVRPGGTAEVRFGESGDSLEVVLAPPPLESSGWRLMVRDARGAIRIHPLGTDGSVTIARPRGSSVLFLSGLAVSVELATLTEDAPDPVLIEPPAGLLTARLPPSDQARGPWRLDLIDLATGRRTAEIDAFPGTELRVPFLRSGTYDLRRAGRSLATVSIVEGQETAIGELRLE